jgi:hypothetical protein
MDQERNVKGSQLYRQRTGRHIPEAADRQMIRSAASKVASLGGCNICSSTIASGLSITARNHFAGVLLLGASAWAVFVLAPAACPGVALRIGSGYSDRARPAASPDPLARHESPWLRCWL